MAVYEISNEKLTVSVNSRGAELMSLRDCETGEEYVWQGDPAFWERRSPILFPFIGGLRNGEYQADGKVYRMEKHGFVRDREFELQSIDENELWFVLNPDGETRECYPYEFRLEAGFRLEERTLRMLFRVGNRGEETMYFSLGGHPAFNCPRMKDGEIADGSGRKQCFLGFGGKERLGSTLIRDEDGLAGEEQREYLLDNGLLPIADDLFDHDALVLENRQVDRVSLAGPDGKPYLTVYFDTPVVGVWSPMSKKKVAPFVCVEPWYGRCDSWDFQGTIADRKWGNSLRPGEIFEGEYRIEV